MASWTGFGYAALAAVANSGIDSSRKAAAQRFMPMELVALVALFDAALLSSIAALAYGRRPLPPAPLPAMPHPALLLRILLVSSGIKVLAGFLYQRALHLSPLSVTIPYLAFTPALLLLTSFLLMRETPGSQGFIGVAVVTAGGYFLAADNSTNDAADRKGRPFKAYSFFKRWFTSSPPSRGGVAGKLDDEDGRNDDDEAKRLTSIGAGDIPMALPSPAVAEKNIRWSYWEGISLIRICEPILALKREEGSLLMLGVAALLSIANSLDKMGAHLSPSSVVFAAIQKLAMAIPLVLFLLITSPGSFRLLFRQCPILLAISAFEVVAFICYLKSLETLLVSYSIAVKRTNVLISVIIGRVFFKEKIWGRLPPILLMLAGMLLIVFA